jgi:dTDP-4-amino-4,6-dideoxygalactose transaminase
MLTQPWKVPLFDTDFGQAEIEAVGGVIHSGWLTMGAVTEALEAAFADFIGVKHAIAVANGTAALHLACLSADTGAGDEVICPSLTFVATANAVIYTGARPVFVDITGGRDMTVCPEQIRAKVTEATRAVIVVHYGGRPCDMAPIMEIAGQFNLTVIEDCAHAPGAVYRGQKCGAIGDVGCFSFFSNKNMTTAEGGMITTNSDRLAEKIHLMRSHGMTSLTYDRHRGAAVGYDVVELGYNYRLDEIRAALGRIQLSRLEAGNTARRRLFGRYIDRLNHVLPADFGSGSGDTEPVYHILPVLLPDGGDQPAYIAHLKKNRIQTSIHYPPVHLFTYYRNRFGYRPGMLPHTEAAASREVTLPLFPSMGEDAVETVCRISDDFFNAKEHTR